MFYVPVSIREAVDSINKTWYLPAVQRPYDWGERGKKKEFIYKLFDSLLRRYPIGTMIVWPTKRKIPYRDFLTDYDSEKLSAIKDKGLWGKADKHLVYDGQQRLQSLYSCLKFTFHREVLCYDLLFDFEENGDAMGFRFFKRNEAAEPNFLRMNELFASNRRERAEFEDRVLSHLRNITKEESAVVRKNLANLWAIFVEEDIKLLSYFPLEKDLSEDEVLDIFKRINTTGMQLTNSEILFSDIKNIQFDFEERIWDKCGVIKKATDGYAVSPDYVLQTLHMLVKNAVRVDPKRVTRRDRRDFVKKWAQLEGPFLSYFSDFLYKEFKINHEAIIPRKDALLPMIAYFYYMRVEKSKKFKDFSSRSIQNMKRYFLASQFLYWDLQSYIDGFHRIVKKSVEENLDGCNFPFNRIRAYVERQGARYTEMKSEYFDDPDYRWLTLKLMMPDREYQFTGHKDERFDPEIDHIFPINPQTHRASAGYRKWADTVWNLQPVKGDINGSKLNQSPAAFFSKHPQYLSEYDFLPTKNIHRKIWRGRDIRPFVEKRKVAMLKFARASYGLRIADR